VGEQVPQPRALSALRVNVIKREPAAPEGGGSETAGAEGDFEDATRAGVGRLAVSTAAHGSAARCALLPNATDVPPCTRLLPTRRRGHYLRITEIAAGVFCYFPRCAITLAGRMRWARLVRIDRGGSDRGLRRR
jgi:hypothetical protein